MNSAPPPALSVYLFINQSQRCGSDLQCAEDSCVARGFTVLLVKPTIVLLYKLGFFVCVLYEDTVGHLLRIMQ